MNFANAPENESLIKNIARKARGFLGRIFKRGTDSVGTDPVRTDPVRTDSVRADFVRTDSAKTDSARTDSIDLRGKLVLLDNDELLLVWEHGLREKRIKKEEEVWKNFEEEFGKGSPKVVEAFTQWQEKLYAYIEREKDKFLRERQGTREALSHLLCAGARTIIVTQGAKPYTQKCFNLLGLSSYISDIYAPAPGKRAKRFAAPVHDHGKKTLEECSRDTLIVGHDPEKDMGWELVPASGNLNDGTAPVLILFDALPFNGEVNAPLDALSEIAELLARKGSNNFLRGFKTITGPEHAKTQHYTFKVALYHNPKRSDRARIPVIYDIRKYNH